MRGWRRRESKNPSPFSPGARLREKRRKRGNRSDERRSEKTLRTSALIAPTSSFRRAGQKSPGNWTGRSGRMRRDFVYTPRCELAVMGNDNRRKSCALNRSNAHKGTSAVRVECVTNKAAHYRFNLVRTGHNAIRGLMSICNATAGKISRERRNADLRLPCGVRKFTAAAHKAIDRIGRTAHLIGVAAQENVDGKHVTSSNSRIRCNGFGVAGKIGVVRRLRVCCRLPPVVPKNLLPAFQGAVR